ncbi:uncharacterized protein LOC131619932 [Vicia villosa]|uniref:uncharacterized protein LOC131619932 n=1 Tax=Vicia villosa TaxID=3911 RepID=UPI00273CF0D3|nr:uncharacterized protein LOC131619932 [Vicia villosa]
MSSITKMDKEIVNDIEHLHITEEDGNYEGSILIDPTLFQKIQKEDLDLTKDANMKGKDRIGGIMKRFNQKDNIIYYGKIINETPTDIADAQGHTYIQLLNKKKLMELKKNIKKDEHRNKIGYIHIGAVQVLIKATFQEGINSPVELILKDDRITDPVDKILGVVEGNLAYGKLKFEIHPNIGIPLNTQRLEQTLTLEHKFLRGNLMRSGDKIFSITYCVNYALTNSHHSITFRNNNRIDIPSLFEDIGKIYYPKKNEITELGTFMNKSKFLELRKNQIPKPLRFYEPENIEESDIDKLSNQVEFIAIIEACKELLWLKKFLQELGFVQDKYEIFVASQKAIHLGKNPIFHIRSKHIDVIYHWTHGVLYTNLFELAKVDTEDNGYDMMIKTLSSEKFETCCDIVGLTISST